MHSKMSYCSLHSKFSICNGNAIFHIDFYNGAITGGINFRYKLNFFITYCMLLHGILVILNNILYDTNKIMTNY